MRYVDYSNADPFRDRGFDSTGAVKGLGWDSALLVAFGAQYRVSDRMALRLGYSYTENPVPDSQAHVNLVSAPIYEHAVYVGSTYEFRPGWEVHCAYSHVFENSIRGPMLTTAGAIPGTSVKIETVSDIFLVGLSVRWGGSGRR